MSAPLQKLTRALSTAPSGAAARAAVSGFRVDTSGYTATGGSGKDATDLSATLEEASTKAVRAYREALRDIPAMRMNFTIIEDEATVRGVIRDLYARHATVTDPAIVDMLVFKARQELREIREQWKSRHHLYGYILAYLEKQRVQEVARQASGLEAPAAGSRHSALLQSWKERGLVPTEVQTWPQYLRWKEEEDGKFAAFAVDNKLFTPEQLERNGKSSCTIM